VNLGISHTLVCHADQVSSLRVSQQDAVQVKEPSSSSEAGDGKPAGTTEANKGSYKVVVGSLTSSSSMVIIRCG
jgi:hypothetical protein